MQFFTNDEFQNAPCTGCVKPLTGKINLVEFYKIGKPNLFIAVYCDNCFDNKAAVCREALSICHAKCGRSGNKICFVDRELESQNSVATHIMVCDIACYEMWIKKIIASQKFYNNWNSKIVNSIYKH